MEAGIYSEPLETTRFTTRKRGEIAPLVRCCLFSGHRRMVPHRSARFAGQKARLQFERPVRSRRAGRRPPSTMCGGERSEETRRLQRGKMANPVSLAHLNY